MNTESIKANSADAKSRAADKRRYEGREFIHFRE